MPKIPVYEQQVRVSGGLDGRRATGEDFGAGAAQALIGAAQGAKNLAAAIYDRDLAADESQTLAATADLKAQLSERRRAALEAGNADDPDWLQGEQNFLNDRIEENAGKLRTGRGQEVARTRGALLLADEREAWDRAAATVAGQKQKINLGRFEDATLRNIAADPTNYARETQGFTEALNSPAYARLDEATKEQYRLEFSAKAARAYLNGIESKQGAGAALKALEIVRGSIDTDQAAALQNHYAQRAQVEEARTKELREDKLRQQINRIIENGGDPEPLIQHGLQTRLFTAEQAEAQREAYQKRAEIMRQVTGADLAFRNGDSSAFAAADGKVQAHVAERWYAEQLGAIQGADEVTQRATINRIVQKGAQLNYVFDGLKNTLTANPYGPEFKRAVNLYRSLESYDPYYASKYVSADQRARFGVYEMAARSGATEQQALEFARAVTPQAVAESQKFFNSVEGRDARKSMESKLSDAPGWFTGSMLNGRQAANDVIDRAAVMMAGNPAADPAAVLEYARKSYEADNVQMGPLWVPRQFLDGVPAEAMANVAGRIVSRLPAVLKSQNLPVHDGRYVLAPDGLSARDGRLQVYDPQGFPVPGLRFGPEDFRKEYQSAQTEKYSERVKQRGKPKTSPFLERSAGFPLG